MAKVKVELNHAGVRDLLRSSEMKEVIQSCADEVQARAGDGYVADTRVGVNRIQGMVRADSYEAAFHTMKHNNLLKAL